jgi:hypothetical protein
LFVSFRIILLIIYSPIRGILRILGLLTVIDIVSPIVKDNELVDVPNPRITLYGLILA